MNETATYKGFDIVIQEDNKKEGKPSNFADVNNVLQAIKTLLTVEDNYYLIKHDKDIQEDGTPKRTHYHLVLCYGSKHSKKAVLEALAKALDQHTDSISIDPLLSEEGAIRYLVHKDNPEKAQYNTFEIMSNDKYYERYILGKELWIIEAMKDSNTIQDLISRVGLDLANKYRGLMKDIQKDRYTISADELNTLKGKLLNIEWLISRGTNDTETIAKIKEILKG